MTNENEVIDELAESLVKVWIDNYTLSGAKAFVENDKKREALVNQARELGIYEAVYSRANDIMHGAR